MINSAGIAYCVFESRALPSQQVECTLSTIPALFCFIRFWGIEP